MKKYITFFILIINTYANNYEVSIEYQNCWASTVPFRDREFKIANLKPNKKLIDKIKTLSKIYRGKPNLYNGRDLYSTSISFSDFNIINKTYFKLYDNILIQQISSRNIREPIEIYKIDYIAKTGSSEAKITYYINKYEKEKYLFSQSAISKSEKITVFLNQEQSKKSYQNCMKNIANDKNERYLKTGLIFLGLLIGLFIVYKLIKKLLKILKKEATKANDKYNSYKIRKIAEEESIRSSVKKSFTNSSEKDTQGLQDLINKAITDGDSETAQALLKILNSKKENEAN